MDDSAHKKPPPRQSLEPRVSAVKSIVKPRGPRAHAPTLPRILESLNQAEQETRGFATDRPWAYVAAPRRAYARTCRSLGVSFA